MDKYFFMSPLIPAVAKPVFWSALGGCAERGLDDCDERSATKQFQQWVSLLAGDDRQNLRRLGLDLKVLRDAVAVWRNLLAVTNPDYRVVQFGGAGFDYREGWTSIESRRPSPSTGSEYGGWSTRLDDAEDAADVSRNLSGWSLTGALVKLDAEPLQDEDERQQVRRVLRSLGPSVRTEVVVGLREPLPEPEVTKLTVRTPDVLLFSTGPNGKPLSWDGSKYCDSRASTPGARRASSRRSPGNSRPGSLCSGRVTRRR